jgi:hypothetical protein
LRTVCSGAAVLVTVTAVAPATAAAVTPGPRGPIAFLRAEIRKAPELWVANPDGSQAGILVRGIGVSPVSWSPDGRRLAYVHEGDLWVADVHAGTRRLAVRKPGIGSASWSPDGTRFAAINANAGLSVVRADGKGAVELVQAVNRPYGSIRSPDWSPDGSRIAYVRHYGSDHSVGSPEIRIIGADGSGDQTLAPPEFGREFLSASWSPDGGRILATATPGARPPLTPPASTGPVYVRLELFGLDGSHSVIPSTENGFGGVWSPDGASIAFVRNGVVSTIDPSGANARSLGLPAAPGSVVWGSGPRLTRPVRRLRALKTVLASVVSGTIRVRRPGAGAFTRLEGSDTVPYGTQIDPADGRMRLSVQTSDGRPGEGVFRGGRFQVTRAGGGLTQLKLIGPMRCGSGGRGTGRELQADADWRFRIRGRRSAATARDAAWSVADRCDGSTLTRVRRGNVTVRDFARGRTRSITGGGRYVARR